MTDIAHEPFIVVGAGFAGLAAAWWAKQAGRDPLLIDAADGPGGAWALMPPDMPCISLRERDRFPDGVVPPGEGPHASAREVVEGIRAFAERAAVRSRYGVRVEGCTSDPEGFTLETSDGAVRADHLVVATGEYGRPVMPDLAGTFDGPLTHSSTFDASTVEPDERVAIVGCGNSGAELALVLADRGARVTLSSRKPPEVEFDPPTRGIVGAIAWWASGLRVDHLPNRGGCTAHTPLKVEPLLDALAKGRVALVGEATGLEPEGLRVKNGDVVAADRIVTATGFRRDTLWLKGVTPLDERGTPPHDAGLSTAHPRLGFVGIPCMRTRRSGFLRGFSDDAEHVVGRLLR